MNRTFISFLIITLLILLGTKEIISQYSPTQNHVMYAILGTGFKENERILLYYINSDGERKTIYSGVYHQVNQNKNVFTSKITGKFVNRLEVYALDRNQSISYSFITKNSPLIKLTVSISKSGFHILYSDN